MSLPTDDPRYTRRGALYVPAGQGTHRWVSSDVNTVKFAGEGTHGRIGVVESSVPPGGGPPPHAHPTSETFYVLSGELEFLDGTHTFTAGAGDLVHVPGGIRHRFLNRGVHTAKLLLIFAPAGPEDGFLKLGQEARPGEQPPLVAVDDALAVAEVLSASGLVLLPDLPGE